MFETIIHRWMRIPYTLKVRQLKRAKKSRVTVLFLHGIGNTGAAWDDVIEKLPDDVQIISIDLLGFGESPSPKWAVYNAKTQARSVVATYLKLGTITPVIVVGHSLGSLVAIEMARRYSLIIRALILCSPPLYDTNTTKSVLPKSDRILRQLYRSALKRPNEFIKLSAFAMKYGLINKSFNVTVNNVESYMATLESMIINQTSFDDAHKLKVQTRILRGTLDPLVIAPNLKKLARENPNVTLSNVIAGHEIKGRFIPAVVEAIKAQLQPQQKSDIKKEND